MQPADTDELDVRQIPKPQRHPMIFARYRPGAYDWRYLEGSQSDRLWRIQIIRITEPELNPIPFS